MAAWVTATSIDLYRTRLRAGGQESWESEAAVSQLELHLVYGTDTAGMASFCMYFHFKDVDVGAELRREEFEKARGARRSVMRTQVFQVACWSS